MIDRPKYCHVIKTILILDDVIIHVERFIDPRNVILTSAYGLGEYYFCLINHYILISLKINNCILIADLSILPTFVIL